MKFECSQCRLLKTPEEFGKTSGKRCKQCHVKSVRQSVKKHRKLITDTDVFLFISNKLADIRKNAKKRNNKGCLADPRTLLLSFTTQCQVCHIECGTRICLDHCHTSGKFRGWLCYNCNFAAERCDTVPDFANKAIAYLQKKR